MFPMDRKPVPVTVEYTARNKRVVKCFDNQYQARRFYVVKDLANKYPKVITTTKETFMSDSTTLDRAAELDLAAPKKARRKKSKAKKSEPKAAKNGQYGSERDHDLPWNDKKVAIFKALKSLGATNAASAVSSTALADKSGLSSMDARHYCYHAMSAGLIKLARVEELRGYGFYLTPKGAKVDPTAELKAAQKK